MTAEPDRLRRVLDEVDKHLIYLEAALKAEPAFREMPEKLRSDLMREVLEARRKINRKP